MCTERVSNWRFSALNEYSTLVDYPWTPCLTCCIQYFMFDWVQVKRRSVNHNSNLIKVVVFASVYWEVRLTVMPTSQYTEANITTLMRFELWLTLLSFTCTHSNMKYWIQYVRQGYPGIINEHGIFIQCWKSSIWHSLSTQ